MQDFKLPPTGKELTLSVDQCYDFHRVHNANKTAYIYPDGNGGNGAMTWKELGEGIIRATSLIKSCIPEARTGSLKENELVVTILAIMRQRTLPFPLSPRNSPAAVAHLVNSTKSKYIWVTEGPMKTIAEQAVKMMPVDAGVTILTIPSFDELYPNPSLSIQYPETHENSPVDFDSFSVIYHSSGSTAFPKPIFVTHRRMWYDSFYFANSVLEFGENDIMSVHATPVFHGMGLMTTELPVRTGLIRATANPKEPIVPMTPDMLINLLYQSKSTIAWCVPIFLETWSHQPRNIEIIKKLKLVISGGAPIDPEVARYLQREGVALQVIYAATEFSVASKLAVIPPKEGPDWWRFADYTHQVLIPQPDEPSVYEVALRKTPYYAISVSNTEIDGHPYYLTSDLVEQHPEDPTLYRVFGRVDDQLMLSTGEKTNPQPLEDIIMKDPNVEWAIMFGRGRLNNGILIHPAADAQVEKIGEAAFRNLIWPSIEKANEYAPAHSRLFKEMIILSKPSKPFLLTGKRTLRKGAIIKEYSDEIDELYQTVEESSRSEVPIPDIQPDSRGWSAEATLRYVQAVVEDIMKLSSTVDLDSDLFQLGCDSLLATYIRNTLLHALRQVAPVAVARTVPSNIVYQNPTIRQLATALMRYSASEPSTNGPEQDTIKQMEALIEKYTQDWPHFQARSGTPSTEDETVFVTGTTGSIGSQILAQLIKMQSVARIFALNRPGEISSTERHLVTFQKHGLELSLLNNSKVVFVEGDVTTEGLGIRDDILEEMKKTVTSIIHCAWRVDFNLSLASFEPAIRGVRKMVNFCLQSTAVSPPRFVFLSSVSVSYGIIESLKTIPEAPIKYANTTNGSGYPQSKWVSECILSKAGKETPLRPVIARVGQVAGGINGYWNIKEWFPALIQASHHIGALPDNIAKVSFVPLDVAASTLIELRHAYIPFAHIIHPRPVTWRSLMKDFENSLHIPIINPQEWVQRLENASQRDQKLLQSSAVHLLDLYRNGLLRSDQFEEREILGLPTYEMKATLEAAPSLQGIRQLGKSDVEDWIANWRAQEVFN
ncbi:hypothetical protein M422DRAFT_775837 [Sphaerobolus stellatus SS14]|nr:hypothetical protein M422DRAFT_775837 [Sphaerobolus stellatus SS14]